MIETMCRCDISKLYLDSNHIYRCMNCYENVDDSKRQLVFSIEELKCECGSSITFGENSKVHSYWCTLYKK